MKTTKRIVTREDKAKDIHRKEGSIELLGDEIFTVKSQSSKEEYKVQMKNGEWVCNCPDFTERQRPCKHILAVEYDVKLKKPKPDCITIIKIPDTERRSWSSYNKAQVYEMQWFDPLLRDLVSIVEEPIQKMGRPRVPLQDKIFCCVKKVYSQLSSRRASSLFRQAEEEDLLLHAPHFNNVPNTLNREDMTEILYGLVRYSASPLAAIERDFAIDSSGFRTTCFNSYCKEKYGAKKQNIWLKAHISSGVLTNVIADAIITDGYAADSPQFIKLVEGTNGYFDISEVSADKAYSSRKNHEFVASIGATAFIPFKKNATDKFRGSSAWYKAYHYFQYNIDDFERHYHKRSNAESTFSSIKQKFGETLKSKKERAQVNELLCKIIAYNITVLIHEMYEHQIDPNFIVAS